MTNCIVPVCPEKIRTNKLAGAHSLAYPVLLYLHSCVSVLTFFWRVSLSRRTAELSSTVQENAVKLQHSRICALQL